MNERLTQLHVEAARYAKEKYPSDIVEWSLCMSEKFAQLIVADCMDICKHDSADDDDQFDFGRLYQAKEITQLIKKHFGVER